MADYNRNQQRGNGRKSNQDWSENRGRSNDEGRYYGNENRDYNTSSEYDENAGWQSRPERERDRDDYSRGNLYGSGRYGRHYESEFNTGNFGNDRDYGYSSNYGYGSTLGSAYDYNRGNSNRDRNLYDRDYQGIGRGNYSGSRLGAGNYGNYGDSNRGHYDRNQGGYGGYSGSNYGGNYGSPAERNGGERNWWDRTTDEVSSWFGDEEAERRRDRDRQLKGEHRGKGPKNYKRSDERIKDDINDRLSDDPFVDASEIDVTVTNGEVTLTGTVDERSSKRRAEDIAENVSGVKNVENRIRVGQQSISTVDTSTSKSTSAVAGSERSRNKDYVTG
jgi:osmotically-inducible protein OsmY